MKALKPLRKAIFPVAGLGSRFLPATKSIPKEMLTIVDRPIIHYAVMEAIEAGCDTLIFVTGRSKRAIADYFDRSPELEAELEAKGKFELLELVRNIIPSHVKCVYVRQSQPLGLGHAVLCADGLIGDDEPFAVMLPDDLIDGGKQGVLSQMLAVHRETQGAAVLALEEVPDKDVHKYGIVKPKDDKTRPICIAGIVEKPIAEDAPSNWSVVGRYILTPDVMHALRTQAPGQGGEIQLTDGIASCVGSERFFGHPFTGKRFDCGNKSGFLEANLHYGLMQQNK